MSLSVAEYTRLMERMDRLDKKLDKLTNAVSLLIRGQGAVFAVMGEEATDAENAALLRGAAEGALAAAESMKGRRQ